jgi:MFS family permease
MSLQQFGGIAAVTMYAALIYKSLGWNGPHQALAINGIQGVLQLFIVLVNTFTVDRFGRKALLIVGFAIQSVALLILASLTTGFPENKNKGAAVVEVAMLFVVGLTYCWSNGPVPPAVASEIFPQHVRDKALGLSFLGQTFWLILLTQPWPMFNEKVGGKSYWLLFSLNVVALVSDFEHFGLVEKSLNQYRSPSLSSCQKPKEYHWKGWINSLERSIMSKLARQKLIRK